MLIQNDVSRLRLNILSVLEVLLEPVDSQLACIQGLWRFLCTVHEAVSNTFKEDYIGGMCRGRDDALQLVGNRCRNIRVGGAKEAEHGAVRGCGAQCGKQVVHP